MKQKERGILLTILILLFFIGGIWNYASLLRGSNGIENYNHYFIVTFLSNTLGIIAGIGLWLWKKWGFYVLLIIAATGLINAIFSIVSTYAQAPQNPAKTFAFSAASVGIFLFILFIVLLWYIALRKKWKLFT